MARLKPPSPRALRRAVERKARKAARKAAAQAAETVIWTAAHPLFAENHPPEPVPTPAEQLKTRLISEGRLAANRANSLKSTGPNTAAGRAASAKNRLVHGLAFATQFHLLANEDPEVYGVQRNQFIEEYQPASTSEHLLVERMVQHNWLHERALRMQNECFGPCSGTLSDDAERKFALFARYATTQERAFQKCLTLLMRQRKEEQRAEDGFVRQKRLAERHEYDLRRWKANAQLAEIRCQNAGPQPPLITRVTKEVAQPDFPPMHSLAA